MKKRLLTFILTICILTHPAWADFKAVATEDGTCRFFYPTRKNTQGWYIKPSSPDMCQNGFVNKHGEVTIYDAFLKPVEQFYGFFNGGYWMGQTQLTADIVSARAENDNVYKVSFELPSNSGFDIKYISQMSAVKQNGKTYSPFTLCAPFRILVQTEDFGLFKDERLTTEIIDEVARHARRLCPAESTIQLFGATTENPKQDDIFFYADINLQTAQIDVKRNEANTFAKQKQSEEISEIIPMEENNITPDNAQSTVTFDDADTTEIITPVPKTPADLDEVPSVPSAMLDMVPNLLTLSRLTGDSVHGTAVVEVTKVSPSDAVATKPLHLKLTGNHLQTGWAVISGDFKHETGKKASELTGSAVVTSFAPCTEAYCTDIK